MIGRTVSHFEIQEKLGQGGMGVVYKARDTKLNRTVALKFLPAQLSSDDTAKARFIQEAQAASALDHANICSVYEIGETDEGEVFIAMAYYDGQTLKYRLGEEAFAIDRATEVATQLAKALERAHEAGIVHRDVKPANIMLTNREEVKLLDFGLAKLIGGAELTIAGSTLGTAAYMSPEQARGEDVTGASDVWALGAVMYEMYTGTKPFAAEYDQALMYSILNEDPNPPSGVSTEIPMKISEMISSCLSKQPANRPTLEEVQTALGSSGISKPVAAVPAVSAGSSSSKRTHQLVAGVVIALIIAAGIWVLSGSRDDVPSRSQGVGGADAERVQSVAVLPFKLRSATDQEASAVFAGGMHDDVLAQLAKISGLSVIARTSVMQFENTTKTVGEIADELGVTAVLEGTIQRSGNRIRINVQLIDAESETPLWGDTYDEELTTDNIFSIQTDLARSIATALHATLSPEEDQRLLARPEISVEAYDLYSAAMYRWRQTASQRQDYEDIVGSLKRAVELEPDFAEAMSLMASVYIAGIVRSVWSQGEKLDEARALINRSLELHPDLAEGHMARGRLLHRVDFRLEEAEAEFRRAIELAPGFVFAYTSLSLLLVELEREDEAIEIDNAAIRLDPLNISIRTSLSDSYFFSGQFEESAAEALKALEMNPDLAYAHYSFGFASGMLGRYEDAVAALEEAVRLEPDGKFHIVGLAWVNALAGNDDRAREIMDTVEDDAAMLKEKAIIYGTMGDLDLAFDALDRSYAENPSAAAPIVGDTTVPEAMKNDPRFADFVEKIGLNN